MALVTPATKGVWTGAGMSAGAGATVASASRGAPHTPLAMMTPAHGLPPLTLTANEPVNAAALAAAAATAAVADGISNPYASAAALASCGSGTGTGPSGGGEPQFVRLLADLSAAHITDQHLTRHTVAAASASSASAAAAAGGCGASGAAASPSSGAAAAGAAAGDGGGTARALERAQAELRAERAAYLQTLAVYSAVRELIAEQHATRGPGAAAAAAAAAGAAGTFSNAQTKAAAAAATLSAANESQLFDGLSELMAIAEASQSLSLTAADPAAAAAASGPSAGAQPAAEANRLGLTEDDLYRASPYASDARVRAQNTRAIQHALVPRIEQRLREQCDALTDFFAYSDENDADAAAAGAGAAPTDLLAQVEATHNAVATARAALSRVNRSVASQSRAFEASNSDLLVALLDVITNVKLKHQFRFDEFEVEYLRERLAAMRAKLGVQRYQLLAQTYTRDTIPALQRTKQHLDSAAAQLQQTHKQTTDKLADYKRAGMGFDELVKEYSDVLHAIRDAQWQAQQLEEAAAR